MARNMVTRTFTTTQVNALVYNNDTDSMEVHAYTVARGYDIEDKKLKKEVKAQVENNKDADYTLVKIKEATKIEKLYGMSEADFIANAKELPPRGEKTED